MEQNRLTAEELTGLLLRYRIGKKPLAALLGWGETTVLRYTEGIPPAKEYADRLLELCRSPELFLELLEEHKDKITAVAYKKSRNAVLLLTASRLRAGASFLMRTTGGDISPSELVFTLYYAQAFSLALNKEPLFSEECELTENNLPYAGIYEYFRKLSGRTLFPEDTLSDEEISRLRCVYEVLQKIGKKDLTELFQKERQYLKTSRAENGGRKLKTTAIAGFFKKIAAFYRITSWKEISRYLLFPSGKRKRSNTELGAEKKPGHQG